MNLKLRFALVLAIIFTFKGCHSQSLVCGNASLNYSHTAGQAVSSGSWPWFVSIRSNYTPYGFCGGTLINEQWVLTSAACMSKRFAAELTVAYLGQHNFAEPYPQEVSRQVYDLIYPDSFDPTTYENDISLLRLSHPVTFTPYIQPVCLAAPGSTFHTGVDSWFSGWGVEAVGPQFDLYEDELPVVGLNECRCLKDFEIPNKTLCAGRGQGWFKDRNTCQGNAGSPLMVQQGSVWVQIGLMSLHSHCTDQKPGVFTDVSKYQDYILWVIQGYTSPGFINFTSPGEDSDLAYNCTKKPTTGAPSVFDSSDKMNLHFSQLFSLCGLTLLLYVMG